MSRGRKAAVGAAALAVAALVGGCGGGDHATPAALDAAAPVAQAPVVSASAAPVPTNGARAVAAAAAARCVAPGATLSYGYAAPYTATVCLRRGAHATLHLAPPGRAPWGRLRVTGHALRVGPPLAASGGREFRLTAVRRGSVTLAIAPRPGGGRPGPDLRVTVVVR